MKRRLGYKGYVIEARANELRDGGFSAEFSVEEHDARGVTETQFYVPNTFSVANKKRILGYNGRYGPMPSLVH